MSAAPPDAPYSPTAPLIDTTGTPSGPNTSAIACDSTRSRTGVELAEAFGPQIAGLVDRGLLARLPDRIRLTPRGRLLGNQVFAEFF